MGTRLRKMNVGWNPPSLTLPPPITPFGTPWEKFWPFIYINFLKNCNGNPLLKPQHQSIELMLMEFHHSLGEYGYMRPFIYMFKVYVYKGKLKMFLSKYSRNIQKSVYSSCKILIVKINSIKKKIPWKLILTKISALNGSFQNWLTHHSVTPRLGGITKKGGGDPIKKGGG